MCFIAQSCPTLCDPVDCSPPGASIHGDSPGKNIGVGNQSPSPGDLPNPGIEPRFPALQVDSLLSEPPGKPSKSCNNGNYCSYVHHNSGYIYV